MNFEEEPDYEYIENLLLLVKEYHQLPDHFEWQYKTGCGLPKNANEKDGNEERSLGEGCTPSGAKSGKKSRGKGKRRIKRQKTHELKKL